MSTAPLPADAVVLITGAGQGIGLATAQNLLAGGARVALIDVNPATLQDAVAGIGDDRALPIVADVRDREAMARAVGSVIEHFGRLDVVVANAGVTPPPATLRSIDLTDFDRVIEINQTGVVNTVHPAIEEIIARRGHVQIIASVAAFAPGVGGAAYMMSKAAVEQLGRALRLELAPHGATAGIAYFGVVDTELARATLDNDPLGGEIGELLPWPLNRRVSADDAAAALCRAILARAPRVIVPRAWAPYSMLRGGINIVMDHRLSKDRSLHSLLRKVENRMMSERSLR